MDELRSGLRSLLDLLDLLVLMMLSRCSVEMGPECLVKRVGCVSDGDGAEKAAAAPRSEEASACTAWSFC